MRIFVLSGQSNMAGHGGVHNRTWDGVVPPECAPDPRILRLSAALQWEEAREPLHSCGVGPGMAFARAVLPCLDAPGPRAEARLGLVPCAVGATAIRKWARGERLYEQMIARSRAAAECGEILAVLWYQGESDTISDHATAVYRENLEKLITNVREDLGMPQLPFIQVAIASGNETNIEKVRSAQFSVSLPNVVSVDALGLPLNEDNIHLSTEAQVKLGEMLAEAYIKKFFHHESHEVALASGTETNIENVRNAQFSVSLPNVETVNAMGLVLNEDNIHLSTGAQVELGEMLAEAYIDNFLPPPLLDE